MFITRMWEQCYCGLLEQKYVKQKISIIRDTEKGWNFLFHHFFTVTNHHALYLLVYCCVRMNLSFTYYAVSHAMYTVHNTNCRQMNLLCMKWIFGINWSLYVSKITFSPFAITTPWLLVLIQIPCTSCMSYCRNYYSCRPNLFFLQFQSLWQQH
jgi:hypothetical protein